MLFRAELTGHSKFSQSADFCQKGWDGHAFKRTPVQDFSIMFLAPRIKKLETYFDLLYFWTFFAQCAQWTQITHSYFTEYVLITLQVSNLVIFFYESWHTYFKK